MAAATLERINPYAKYGLKRRPTYDEIIGLIGENETLSGQLPDRTATQFKASQEGSFFDGLDHLEILKEQQSRIQERQMRELLMRQNIGGGTYNAMRIQQQMREGGQQVNAEVGEDTNFSDAQMQTELERRAREYADRQDQSREARRTGGFLSRTTSSVMEGVFGGLNRNQSNGSGTQRQVPTYRISSSDSENEGMQTAGESSHGTSSSSSSSDGGSRSRRNRRGSRDDRVVPQLLSDDPLRRIPELQRRNAHRKEY